MSSSLLASTTLLAWKALESYSCDPAALFEQAGLDAKQLYDPNARFPYAAVNRLWTLALTATGDPAFGLRVAEHWHPSALHALGYAWLASATLKDAFERAMRYFRIVTTDPEDLILEQDGDVYRFVIATDNVAQEGIAEEYDAMVGAVVVMCRISLSEDFAPHRVLLKRPEPVSVERFAEFFRCPLAFSAPRNELTFSYDTLHTPLPTANMELARVSDQIAAEYLAKLDRGDVLTRLRAKLVRQLPSGQATQEAMAKALNLSVRSLQRKLNEYDTNYKQVLDQVRCELAQKYIANSLLSIAEISYLLGFSEPANFSRAFRRWTGVSPVNYRGML